MQLYRLNEHDRMLFRKTMVSSILATDMSVHFEVIGRVVKVASTPEGFQNTPYDKKVFCELVIKMSDLYAPTKSFEVSKAWADLVTAEFKNQVMLEKSMGLPYLAHMNIIDERSQCDSEIQFITTFVLPLYAIITPLWEECRHLEDQAKSNLESWKTLKSRLEK